MEVEVDQLIVWCKNNELVPYASKRKEMVIDFRRPKVNEHSPFHIQGETVEMVESLKFLGVTISKQLTWTTKTSQLVKRAQQRLFFLRKQKQAKLPQTLPLNFYRSTVETNRLRKFLP